MNNNVLVIFEYDTFWHISLWEKRCLLLQLIKEIKITHTKQNPEKLLQEIFTQLGEIKNTFSSIYICLSPKNVLVKYWEFPFWGNTKALKALTILMDSEIPNIENLESKFLFAHSSFIKRKTNILSASCSKKILELWKKTFLLETVTDLHLSFFPFPYLNLDNIAKKNNTFIGLMGNRLCVFQCKNGIVSYFKQIQMLGGVQVEEKALYSAWQIILQDLIVDNDTIIILSSELEKFKHIFSSQALFVAENEIISTQEKILKKLQSILKNLKIRQKKVNIYTSVPQGLESIEAKVAKLFVQKTLGMRIYAPSFNFTQHIISSSKKTFSSVKKEIIPLCFGAFCALSCVVWLASNVQKLKNENTFYTTRINEIYKNLAPQAPDFKSYKQMKSVLQSKINESALPTSSSSILQILMAIHNNVPQNENILIEQFIFDKKIVTLQGNILNYDELELFKNALEKVDFFQNIKISQATLIQKKNMKNNFQINFKLSLEIVE